MEDIGQLIFVVLFILFGLISSSKKKASQKPRVQDATRPPPSRARMQEEVSSEVELPLPSEAPASEEEPGPPKRALAEELLVFLQGGQPEPVVEPIVPPAEIDDEAVSIETLEPAGSESHKKFHERYVDAVQQPRTYEVEKKSKARPYCVKHTAGERPYFVQEATTPQPYAICDLSKGKQRLTRSELRHAFVMKEILGPPKALE